MLIDRALLLNFFPDKLKPWAVCLSAALFYFCQVLEANMLNSANIPITQTFSITASEMGHISIAFFYANILFLFFAGTITGQLSRRKILISACSLNALSVTGFALAQAPWQLFVCHFITGFAGTFSLVCCMNLASHWFPKAFFASITGITAAIGGLGAITAQTPLVWIIHSFDWRIGLLLVALLQAIVTLFIILFVQDSPKNNKQNSKNKKRIDMTFFIKKLKLAAKNFQNWSVGFFMAFLNTAGFVLGGLWGNLYLTQVHKLDSSIASMIVGATFIGALAGNFLIGIISDYFKKQKILLQLSATLAIISTTLLFNPSNNIVFLFITFFAIGFATGGVALSYAVITKNNRPNSASSAQGFSLTLLMTAGIFQFIFAKLMELSWDHTVHDYMPIYSIQDFHHALLILPASAAASLLMTFFIKEKAESNH